MEKYDIKNVKIELYNVLFCVTSEQDYSMTRLLLLENMPDTKFRQYVLAEGGHCSCYGFDETEWHCLKLTKDELLKILEQNDWGLRKELKRFITNYF